MPRPSKRQALEELALRRARTDFLSFCRFVWPGPGPLLEAPHVTSIANRLTTAAESFLRGEPTHLRIHVPPRHGKSTLCSVLFPAFFAGLCAERQPSVILTGYGAQLVQAMSQDCKRIMNTPAYQQLFPGIKPAHGSDSVERWQVDGSRGRFLAQGLSGALTGHGGDLIVVDDAVKSAAEARSRTYRDNTWAAFTANLMTRSNGPGTITLYVATPWHVDDVGGRITKYSGTDPDFPVFDLLRFPARNEDGSYLWEERFGRNYYEQQYALLGSLSGALLDCNPQPEGAGRFNPDNIVWHDTLDGWPVTREVRGWDLASSTAQRSGSDPDFTVGVRLGTVTREGVIHIYIRSIITLREEAPARNAAIVAAARNDGPGVVQHIEAFGAYKDAYTDLARALQGICRVQPSRLAGDKSAKAAPLEPVFEAGNVHIYRPGVTADGARLLRDELSSFPNGTHDDIVDALSVAFAACSAPKSTILF